MGQIFAGFIQVLEGVIPRCRARAQARELREDVPHPVRAFAAAADLGQGALEVVLLRTQKTREPVRVIAAAGNDGMRHVGLQSLTCATHAG
jgi:hypothetical protein